MKKKPTLEERIKSEVAKQIPKVDVGMAVAIPSTTQEKMRAICELSSAINQLAKALNSTNVEVRIENCNFQNQEIGLNIGQ